MPAHGARLFFAVEVPEQVRRELASWARRAARGARVLDPASLHLTLLFLGSRPFEEIDTLAAALARAVVAVAGAAGGMAIELSLGAPVWLPPRRPRALAVEVHDEGGELSGLHEALLSETGEAGQPHFRPHITVARARPGTRVARDFPDPTPQLRFTATAAVLHRSFLEPSGARYEPLVTVPLQAGG